MIADSKKERKKSINQSELNWECSPLIWIEFERGCKWDATN